MTTPRTVSANPSLSRLALFAGFVLFALAACCAGGVITGIDPWAFGFGGFAAWVISGAVA